MAGFESWSVTGGETPTAAKWNKLGSNDASFHDGTGIDDGPKVPIGGIILWSGSVASIPNNWQLCNGANGTPDLRNRFVVGAGSGYAVGATGGAATHVHGSSNLVALIRFFGKLYGRGRDTADINWFDKIANVTTGNTSYDKKGGTAVVGNTDAGSSKPPYFALCYIQRMA